MQLENKLITNKEEKDMKSQKEKWALISVFDTEKEGAVAFAKRLVALGWKIISSGGTAKVLRAAGIEVKDVEQVTGLKPMLKHRVATLHPRIHAGLIADYNDPEQMKEMADLGWELFDLVYVTFYPLQEAVDNPAATTDSVVEKTDIGGPCMIRSAAKGLRITICAERYLEPVLKELEETGDVSIKNRQKLRAFAELAVARYVGTSAAFHLTSDFPVFQVVK